VALAISTTSRQCILLIHPRGTALDRHIQLAARDAKRTGPAAKSGLLYGHFELASKKLLRFFQTPFFAI
jgi:hypothetical protein